MRTLRKFEWNEARCVLGMKTGVNGGSEEADEVRYRTTYIHAFAFDTPRHKCYVLV
jgi:hypothetical protein